MEALEIIKKYGLKVGFKRQTTFLIYTSAPVGYTLYLRKNYGLSYHAVGVLKQKDDMLTLVNPNPIAQQMEKFLHAENNRIHKILAEGEKAIGTYKEKIREMEEKAVQHPQEALSEILEFTLSQYWGGIFGIFNCLYRYAGDKGQGLSEELLLKIADVRNRLAHFYPVFDALFVSCANTVGLQEGFDGKLLQNCTPFELREYLREGMTNTLEKKLREREDCCIYFFIEDGRQEVVTTDRKIIEGVRVIIEHQDSQSPLELHGKGVSPGKAQGYVYNAAEGNGKKEDSIFVTHMTTAKDLLTLQKCKAIVTDEGGILSHAAIIARELQKPCVIGTKIATKVLKTGDLVVVDADKGIVKKVR